MCLPGAHLNLQRMLQIPTMPAVFRNRDNPVEANGNELISEGKLPLYLGLHLFQIDKLACPLKIP